MDGILRKDGDDKIPVGISSCLLGERVRYDGGHKHAQYITGTLGEYFSWIPICPELEIGLGVPRPAIRLQLMDDEAVLWQESSKTDLSDKMTDYAIKKVRAIQKQDIYGYILKSKSPSCGMERLKIYREPGRRPLTNGVGFFARVLLEVMPNLPVEEEGRLCDPVLRENWVNRVFTYFQFKTSLYPRPTVGKLVKWHSSWKFSILAHCEVSYRSMGRLVADAKQHPIKEVMASYETALMGAMKKKATKAKHVNVLEHMAGFFKKSLSDEARKELSASIQDYRNGYVPVIVPITLIRHYAKIQKVEYLLSQSYLSPHPKELGLLSSL